MTNALVIGADSRIGSAVLARLSADGIEVAGTTRRRQAASDGTFYLDLNRPLAPDSLPRAGVCLIAAAVTSLQACQREPQATGRINVDAAVELATAIADRGCFTLLLSTNQVFSGDKAFPGEEEPTRPSNAYGGQKARAEEEILKFAPHTAVLRLSKVLEARPPLFVGWRDRLSRSEAVEAFADMVFAPLSLTLTVDVIVRLLERRQPGIFQASGDEDVTYLAAARMLASRLGAGSALVKSASAASAPLGFTVPRNTTLGMERLKNLLGIETPSSRSAIDRMLDRVVAGV